MVYLRTGVSVFHVQVRLHLSTRRMALMPGPVAALLAAPGEQVSVETHDHGAEAQLLSEAFIAALEALRHPKSTVARWEQSQH